MKFLWIFDIDAIWTLPFLTAVLWALGGSGVKYFRHVGVPLLIVIAALSLGVNVILISVLFTSLFIFISVPYGSDLKSFLKRLDSDHLYFYFVSAVGAIYAASMLPLVFFHGRLIEYIFGIIISGIGFGGLTYCSQKFDFPKWKFVELFMGAIIGFIAVKMMV